MVICENPCAVLEGRQGTFTLIDLTESTTDVAISGKGTSSGSPTSCWIALGHYIVWVVANRICLTK